MASNLVIIDGTTNNDKRYYNTNNIGGTLGSTTLTYATWNTVYTSGTGISINASNQIAVSTVPIANGGTG